MRLIFAAFTTGLNVKRRERFFRWAGEAGVDAVLVSLAYEQQITHASEFAATCPGQADLWLDSGAFTAWTKGIVIEPDDILRGVEKAVPQLSAFRRVFVISLDRIPGRFGRKPWKHELEAATRDSVANWKYLLGHGLETVPVHHQGEPMSVLDEYLDGAEYVGISPANDRSMTSREAYVVKCWHEVVKPRVGKDKVVPPTHSFGNTAPRIVRSFPFYSADSASWKVGQMWGRKYEIGPTGQNIPMDPVDGRLARQDPVTVLKHAVKQVRHYEAELQGLWRRRGISWREPQGIDWHRRT